MNPVHWYIAAGVGVRALASLGLLLSIYIVFDLIELKSLSQLDDPRLLAAYVLKVPSVVTQLAPLSLSLGIALQIGALKQHGEWVGMISLGIPRRTLLGGIMLVPIVSTSALFAAVYYLAPGLIAEIPRDRSREPAMEWIRHGSWLLQLDAESTPRTAVRIDETRPLVRFDRGMGSATAWTKWQELKGFTGDADGPPITTDIPRPRFSEEILGTLTGASLTLPELSAAIRSKLETGRDPAPLAAELGLRAAMVAAALCIPLATLAFNLLWDGARLLRLTGTSLLLTLLYYVLTAFFWNGVHMGIWSHRVLAVGSPFAFTAISGAALALCHRALLLGGGARAASR